MGIEPVWLAERNADYIATEEERNKTEGKAERELFIHLLSTVASAAAAARANP